MEWAIEALLILAVVFGLIVFAFAIGMTRAIVRDLRRRRLEVADMRPYVESRWPNTLHECHSWLNELCSWVSGAKALVIGLVALIAVAAAALGIFRFGATLRSAPDWALAMLFVVVFVLVATRGK